MKKSKLMLSSAVALGLLVSSQSVGFASSNFTSVDNNENQSIDLSLLSDQQLSDYQELIEEGYQVDVSLGENGYVSLNGYKTSQPTNSLNKTTDSPSRVIITPQAEVGYQTFTVKQKIYYGYISQGTVTGSINVKYVGSTVYIQSSTLKEIQGAYAISKTHTNGNPGRVDYDFKKYTSNGAPSGARVVPFETVFKIYPSGKMTFFNNLSYY